MALAVSAAFLFGLIVGFCGDTAAASWRDSLTYEQPILRPTQMHRAVMQSARVNRVNVVQTLTPQRSGDVAPVELPPAPVMVMATGPTPWTPLLTDIFSQYGVEEWVPTFENIILWESNNDPLATNPIGGAAGLFQYIVYWHPGLSSECAYNPVCATTYTAQQIQARGYDFIWTSWLKWRSTPELWEQAICGC